LIQLLKNKVRFHAGLTNHRLGCKSTNTGRLPRENHKHRRQITLTAARAGVGSKKIGTGTRPARSDSKLNSSKIDGKLRHELYLAA
jgi:hypothetical protein